MKRLVCASTPRSHHNPVRLACVKHAASVHPEPGSNSRIIICLIPVTVKPWLSCFRQITYIVSFLFLLLVSVLKFIFLLNFQGCITVYLSRYRCCFLYLYRIRSFSILPQPNPYVKYFFEIILDFRRWVFIVSFISSFCQGFSGISS